MKYPQLRLRDRGDGTGRAEIVFDEDQNYEQAQSFADRMIETLGLTIIRRLNGPHCWMWDGHYREAAFVFGYDDFPCETTLWAANAESDRAIEELFAKLVKMPPSPA